MPSADSFMQGQAWHSGIESWGMLQTDSSALFHGDPMCLI